MKKAIHAMEWMRDVLRQIEELFEEGSEGWTRWRLGRLFEDPNLTLDLSSPKVVLTLQLCF